MEANFGSTSLADDLSTLADLTITSPLGPSLAASNMLIPFIIVKGRRLSSAEGSYPATNIPNAMPEFDV